MAMNNFLLPSEGSGKQRASAEGGGGHGGQGIEQHREQEEEDDEEEEEKEEAEDCEVVVPEGPGEAAAARFCCALLELLPPPLLAPLAERVVLPAACQVRHKLSGYESGSSSARSRSRYISVGFNHKILTGCPACRGTVPLVAVLCCLLRGFAAFRPTSVAAPSRTSLPMLHTPLCPLSQVLGGHAACHRLLLRHARESARQRCQLHHLGVGLGVEVWTRDFWSMPREQQQERQQQQLESEQQQERQQQQQLESEQQQFESEQPQERQQQLQLKGGQARQVGGAGAGEGEQQQGLGQAPGNAPEHATAVSRSAVNAEQQHVQQPQAAPGAAPGASARSVAQAALASSAAAAATDTDTASGLAAVPSPAPSTAMDVSGELLKQRRSVIAAIRREEFGLADDDLEAEAQLGEAGRKLREVQNARMGRALQRLSHELYSRDTHFVLELVQVCEEERGVGRQRGGWQEVCEVGGHTGLTHLACTPSLHLRSAVIRVCCPRSSGHAVSVPCLTSYSLSPARRV